VPVDYPQVIRTLQSCRTDADYVAAVGSSVIAADATGNRRPSIETGFHALLGKVVMHSHSVWGNLVNCAENGEEILKEILPQALWIPYQTPGLALTRQIQTYLAARPDAEILFLQNHGVIISAATTAQAWDWHEDVNRRIRARFNLPDTYQPTQAYTTDRQHILFPDQAVYLGNKLLAHSKASVETLQAYDFLRATMDELNLTPHYLPEAEAEFLVNMEAEKYRQKVASQSEQT